MPMGDDVGVATAEAIKADLEAGADCLPVVVPGRVTVAHEEMGLGEIDARHQDAFRFAGVGALGRRGTSERGVTATLSPHAG